MLVSYYNLYVEYILGTGLKKLNKINFFLIFLFNSK